ncbi:MAG: transglutaminase domain-containing protein [Planctomycetota bacterium]
MWLPACLLLVALAPVGVPQAESKADAWDVFEEAAKEEHGAFGEEAARFLREHRTALDDDVEAEWLIENLRFALQARARFPWAAELSDELFLNDVLPHALLDERRESWRPQVYALVAPLVEDCESAEEAAQLINERFFDLVGVHYNTGRKRPNACMSESIAQGRATCTGLTILYVEACRAVAIPARAAGVRLWHDDRGNHTWPELWDGERWRFTGADEFDAQGLDRGWFVGDAAKAVPGDRDHAVWASSWKETGQTFPLAWRRSPSPVHAIDVTARYLGDRDRADATLAQLSAMDALGEEAAQRLVMELEAERVEEAVAALSAEVEAGAIQVDGKTLRLKERVFGDEPDGGRSLWISMHGGGGAPARVNDGQWENQIKLYEPEEGIVVAPRAPTDTWNLWHQAHIDPLFDRLIAGYVACRGVNPDRVFLMGYSAGGDGVYQLAPRMADRFAAAAMMAGHPNETKPDGLRNLPFALFMGGDDESYGRNTVAAQWKEALAALRASDPEGYVHEVTIYEGKGHWMDGEDQEALPWMARYTRNAWPKRIVWLQDDVRHDRFYWLGVEPDAVDDRARIVASVDGDTISITTDDAERVTLWLHDRLIDLDRPISVVWNGTKCFEGEVGRTAEAIQASLASRPDARMAATARLVLDRP